jgi:serine/threonine protein kinase
VTEPVSESPVSPPEASPEACLDSWKEIAAYFNRDKRTVQRWERNEGMPVHRHQHDKHGTVYALKAELDEWWKGRRARIERQEEAEKHSILKWPAPVDAIRTPVPVSVDARYETLAEIGSGGMGIVFKARDRETGEVVALKVLRTELAKDEAWMDRFKDELRLARKVTHRNVCRIHEFVRTEDCAYISMEFVDGESLRQILNRFGALSARTAVGISEQICAGLAEAHEEGVIHRDLKPENIMLDRHGQIKVMDFGVAARLGIHEQNPGQILGTPAYMAPEQTEGRTPDKRTDVYAVGLILYEMVTGRPAFVGNTPLEVALKQVREMPAKPSSLERGIPERVESAIIKSLQKSPQARFQTARELAEALKDEFEARPVLAPSETIELLRHVEGPRWRKWDWVLLALGLASAAAFLLLNQRVWPVVRQIVVS